LTWHIDKRYIDIRYPPIRENEKEPTMAKPASRSAAILMRIATLLLVIAVGFGVFILVGAAFGYTPGNEIAVHTVVPSDRLGALAAGEVVTQSIDVAIRVHDPSSEQSVWFVLRDLPAGIVVIAATWLVRGLLRSVRDGEPFAGSNVTRLRALAAVVLVGIPLAELVRSAFAERLATSVGLAGPGITLGVPGNAILGGLALIALSEVFSEGIRMRDDLVGTV
jgi:hypothetical protein